MACDRMRPCGRCVEMQQEGGCVDRGFAPRAALEDDTSKDYLEGNGARGTEAGAAL